VVNTVASALDEETLGGLLARGRAPVVSPPAFRHRLVERARAADKRIVLPEGEEPRTIAAANICARRGIARCILLGDPDRIRAAARREGITLEGCLELLDPRPAIPRYVAPLVELRRHKGMHEAMAEDILQDNVWLGTMMLKLDEVDGLVSGAEHTTANTIRPALQIVKMAPGYSLVSSVFFMCLPQQVLVYGDCAINPDPSAEELADIAIQSADSAAAFGIEPRVAMISYSTGTSGTGQDVEKVAQATRIARQRRPDLLLDGPLQYDAASVEWVGRQKAPHSEVAGRATVFVFPDLNTGNTTYKAVQRSAQVVSIGPMLQGLARPVNDLSRGALVEDIVFTVALTAIQADQLARRSI
jgi:phosphate acetyltransferase